MKQIFFVYALALFGLGPIHAQIGTPSEFDAFVFVDFYRYTPSSRTASINFNNEAIITNKVIPFTGFHVEQFSRPIKPGVVYPLTITRDANLKYGIGISAPEGYIAEINGVLSNTIFKSIENTSTETITYKVALRSIAAMQADKTLGVGQSTGLRIGDIGWEVGLGKYPNGNGAGFVHLGASEITAQTTTRAALGVHIPPYNLGEFHPIYQDLNNDLIFESIRQIRAPQCFVDFVDHPISAGAGSGYQIRFYQSGTFNAARGLYDPVGPALVTYSMTRGSNTQFSLVRTDAWGSITSQVTSTINGTLKNWDLLVTGGAYAKRTTLVNTPISNGRQEDAQIFYQTSSAGLPTQAAKTFNIRRTYRNITTGGTMKPIREKISSITYNQGQTNARTERYTYWDADTGSNFGRIKFSEDPFGSWKLYTYDDILYTGPNQTLINDFIQWSLTNRVYGAVSALMPRQGRPVEAYGPESDAFNFDIATSTINDVITAINNGQVITSLQDLAFGWDEFDAVSTRSRSIYRSGGLNRDVARSFTSPIVFPLDYNASGLSSNYIELTRKYSTPNVAAYWGEDDRSINWIARYVPFADGAALDPRLAFKPYMSITADEVKRVHGYAATTNYEGITNAWVEVDIQGLQPTEIIDNTAGRIVSITSEQTNAVFNADFSRPLFQETCGRLLNRCKTSTGQPFKSSIYPDALTRYVSPNNQTHNGVTMRMDGILLVNGKSSKAVRAFNNRGELKREEKWIYTSAGAWSLVATTLHDYDLLGHLVSSVRRDGSSNAERQLYEAQYDGLMLRWQTDADGVKTTYLYDGLGRLASSSVSSSHSVVGVPSSITTSVNFDAMDHLVQTQTGQLAQATEFDAMGLTMWERDKNSLTTTYAYSRETGAGKKVSILYPGGGSEVRVYSKNGRLKSVTGSAVVAQYYTYSYDVGTNLPGSLIVRVDTGLPSSNSTTHPYSITRVDWNGRNVRSESSSPTAQNFIKDFSYSSLNKRITGTTETEVSLSGATVAQTLVKNMIEDQFGSPMLFGTDVDGGGISEASTDRIAKSETLYVAEGGALYSKKVEAGFPVNGAATQVTVTTKTKLNGFSGNEISEISVTDANGNTTQTVTTLDRANAITSGVTTHQDLTTESSSMVLGFAKSFTSRQGMITERTFDDVGRVSLEIVTTQERSSAVLHRYEAGKLRKTSVTEGLNGDGSGTGYLTSYGYDSAGRVSLVTFPNLKEARTSYNFRGQPIKTWGSGIKPVWNEYDPDFSWLLKQHSWPVLEASSPDFLNAATPPAGSTVVQWIYHGASGKVTKRTDGFGSADARATDYTYDVAGNLRTIQTPSSVAGTNSSATARTTITHQYDPKTLELRNTTYTGNSAPSLAYTYERHGAVKTLTEGGGAIRTFHYNLSGNGVTALRRVAEDLPSYYNIIPSLVTNDSAHTANRVIRNYTDSGMLGLFSGSAHGMAGGQTSALASVRGSATIYIRSLGRVSGAFFEGENLSYGYELGGVLMKRRTTGLMNETRDYTPDRSLLQVIDIEGAGKRVARHVLAHDSMARLDSAHQSGADYQGYGGELYTQFGYDGQNRLTSAETHAGPSLAAPLLAGRSFGYTYDLADNRRSTKRPDSPQGMIANTIGINSLNELTTLQSPQWAEVSGMVRTNSGVSLLAPGAVTPLFPNRKDQHFHVYYTPPAGTILRKPTIDLLVSQRAVGTLDPTLGKYRDGLDRRTLDLTVAPPTETLKYDGRSNLVNDALWTYTWDGADRLVGIECSEAAIAAGLPKVKLSFKYDGMGRRYSKASHAWTGSGFAANPDQVTLYWWDGWKLLREAKYSVTAYSGSNPSAASFVREIRYSWGVDASGTLERGGATGGLCGIVTRQAGQPAEAVLFPVYDGNHNIISLLNAAGEVKANYEYDPYGNLLRASGPAAASNPYRFATKYYDSETKLVYHDLRYYSPRLGRFLGRDPILEAGGRNLHAYVGNSPVNGTDFLGMATTFFNQSGRGFSGGLFSGAGSYSISTQVWGGFGSHNHGIYHYAPPINVRDYVNYQSTVFDTRFASVATRVETVFKNASFSYNTWTVAEGHFYGKEPNLAKFDKRYQSQLSELLDEAGIGGEGRLVLFDQLEGLKDLPDRNMYRFGARNLEMIAGGMEVPGILTEAAGKAVMSPWSDAVAAFGGYDAYTGEEASRLQGASMLVVGLLSGPLDDVVRGAGALRYVDNAAESAALGGRAVLGGETTRKFELVLYSGQPTAGSWPGNRGFLGSSSKMTLEPGTLIDRYGFRSGTFVSPQGTPFPMRALPDETLLKPFETYRVRIALDVDGGIVAPAFGKPGLGTQYELPFSVNELIQLKMLELFTP